MAKYSQGEFIPVNREKYVGSYPITYRSSWELSVMRVLDQHPSVSQWASESLKIPYMHPLTGKWTFYVPDFLVIYVDKSGNKRAELVEIKPAKEAYADKAKSKRDRLVQAVNHAKWQSAIAWCHKHGLTFRVMTEDDLFKRQPRKRK